MPRWGKLAILLAVLLITVNAQCLAACAVLPCAEHPAQAQEPPCHQQAPEQESAAAPCGHPVFVADSDQTMPAAALAPIAWIPTEVAAAPGHAPDLAISPIALSPPGAITVLRI